MKKLTHTPTSFRIPAEILAQLKEWADQEQRSVNSQVVVILQKALANRDKPA